MAGVLLNLTRPAIAPSILTADFGRLAEQITEAESAGADVIHLDVMDGHFVPNISFGPRIVSTVRDVTRLPLDVHLMIEEPERYIDAFADAGADVLTIHAEATQHLHRAIQQIRGHDIDAGVAINPATPLDAIAEVLEFVDLILVMSVNPGFGGQTLIPATLRKVQRLREILDQPGRSVARIEVDGGIQHGNIARVVESGADILVAGSSVYNDDLSVAESIARLRAAFDP